MNLDDIQPTLLQIVQAIPALSAVVTNIVVDDGNQDSASEAALQNSGLSIRILPPQCVEIEGQGRHNAVAVYSTTLWVRTNPKVLDGDVSRWNPMTIEAAIIRTVIASNSTTSAGQFPFQIPKGLEPESDF